MKLPLSVTPEAEQELVAAIDWYDEQQPGFGKIFQSRVLKTIRKIAEHPELYAVVFENARSVRVKRHPHQIIYSIEPQRVVVWSIFHASRNPEIWKQRIAKKR